MERILVTGALGQIGSELTVELRKLYGTNNVIATDVNPNATDIIKKGPFEALDVTNKDAIDKLVLKYNIDGIVHMAAILSATGEQKPELCWNVNMNGFCNILKIALEYNIKRVLIPSSIAVFGPETPKINTPQETVLKPTTMYGVTKVSGELLGNYHVQKYNLDVRGLRYPGIISSETLPGGGTTDYAIDIFYEALKNKKYTCFVKEDTKLPMMYMPDCLKATINLFRAETSKLKHHADFNVAGMSFTVGELAAEIKKHIPGFEIEYKPDYRQEIADSWPNSIDDSAAREEWGWQPSYNLANMTKDMLDKLSAKLDINY